MDVSNVFEGNEDSVEEYKIYMYTMFAKELARCIRRYLVGRVYVDPDPINDTVVVSITRTFNEASMFSGSIDYSCKVEGILNLMKNDGARDAAKAVVKEFKDQVWHTLFKELKYKKKEEPNVEPEEDPTPATVEVNDYDDDVRRLYFNEKFSVDQISESLGVHVDAVNKVIESLIN